MVDDEKRMMVRHRAGGMCEVCGVTRPLHGTVGVRGEVAHKVAKVDWALKRYGETIIDHVDNLAWTCPGKCNGKVLITFKKVPRDKLMTDIAIKLAGEEIDGSDR